MCERRVICVRPWKLLWQPMMPPERKAGLGGRGGLAGGRGMIKSGGKRVTELEWGRLGNEGVAREADEC